MARTPRGLPTGHRSTVEIPANLASTIALAVLTPRMHLLVDRIAERADELVPVGKPEDLHPDWTPGVLKASQETAVFRDHIGRVTGQIAYTAYWAHMVHDGTVHMAANPWLLNAALEVMRTGAA